MSRSPVAWLPTTVGNTEIRSIQVRIVSVTKTMAPVGMYLGESIRHTDSSAACIMARVYATL